MGVERLSPGICPACNQPIVGHDSTKRKQCHDQLSGYTRKTQP
jgi:hypothetical protein